MSAFSYIGQAYTADAFVQYVQTYDFGSVPPSFVVIHHTYNPDASWAPISADQGTWWDRNEAELSDEQITAKRKTQLDGIKNYYVGKGWTTGPHLFVDERWIWLFTPMYDIGTHAASGNSYHDAAGLHYSIGIEVVGYYEHHAWPPSIQALLRTAVQALQKRLGNFTIAYKDAPTNRPDLHDHSISFHCDYNKPECPGAMITPDYAIPILAAVPPTPVRYGVKGVPVYQAESLTGKVAGWLLSGTPVEIDKTYTNGAGHMTNPPLGFVDMDALERL